MSFHKDENSDLIPENMEQEDKVNIEEASVNLGYVKKEFNDEELPFDENQYKIATTFENVLGQSSTEQQKSNRDSLLAFLDEDFIMEIETGTIILEGVKEENKDLIRRTIEESYCNKCGGNYQGYCVNCSSLSHILNNLTPNLNSEPVLNTTPLEMLEIREISRRRAVFALKTLPKGIILGPFEGIAPIESTTGLQWKIKNKKFVNDQNGNWMKYIESVANRSSKNLDIFQIDGILYFETSREIQEGEELLVCYREEKEEMLKSDKGEEFYLVPVQKEEYGKVFGCTHCCLGFCLERCLVEHKSKCPHGVNIEDFEIIQCRYCKVWLEKEEHLESHMVHCRENYNRLCRNRNLTDFASTITADDQVHQHDEITPSIDVNASYSTLPKEIMDYFHDKNMGITHTNPNDFKSHSKHFQCEICKQIFGQKDHLNIHIKNKHSNRNEKEYKCSECCYQTNLKGNLKSHLDTHTDVKNFECDICKQRFGRKDHLRSHIKNRHSNTNEKEYKCSTCSYQTNSKGNLKIHMDTHSGVKQFQCEICKQRFGLKCRLNVHIKYKHSYTNEKEYKCSTCSYQTNRKCNFNRHLGTHSDVMNFQCDICKQRFGRKDHLRSHIKNRHSNTNEKEYKCSTCSYQTNRKGNLKIHMDTHSGVTQFQCEICKQIFGQKDHLNVHIKNKHSNRNEKEYKCSECCYQTNLKGNLKSHLDTHTDVKNFECDICKQRFGRKDHLRSHIKNRHSNTNEKEYKCSTCSYQTNRKGNLKIHMDTHSGVKQFQCEICKQTFGLKCRLNVHIKYKHSYTNEKEYKCSTCSYQTNHKCNFNSHLGTHSDVMNFQCDICKQRFGQKGTLKVHIKNKHSNTNEKEYKCSECSYQTNNKCNFNRHLGTHSDVKNFECDICKQRFRRKGNLNVHIKLKHSNRNEKEYKCSECSYQTNDKGHLKRHLSTHTGIKNFQCDICKQRFGRKDNLKLHIKNKHSNINKS